MPAPVSAARLAQPLALASKKVGLTLLVGIAALHWTTPSSAAATTPAVVPVRTAAVFTAEPAAVGGDKMARSLLAWRNLGGNCEILADQIIGYASSGNTRAAVERFVQFEPTCTAFLQRNDGF